jgi:hypothetical protein
MAGRACRLGAAVLAIALLAGCSEPAAQPYPGACDPLLALSWSPPPDSAGVPLDPEVRVVFSDYPDPDTLGASNFVLTTGVFYYTGSYSVDLMDKAAVFRPANLLRPENGYTITVLPTVHSLSGCPTTVQQRSFRTGSDVAGLGQPPAVAFGAVQPIFAARCGGAGCHRPGDGAAGDACLDGPAAGLSLCDRDALQALVNVPSREVSALLLVRPNDSARSYLLRKLLPATPGGGPVPGTLGHRDPPGDPLTDAELRTVSRWIDSGAGP